MNTVGNKHLYCLIGTKSSIVLVLVKYTKLAVYRYSPNYIHYTINTPVAAMTRGQVTWCFGNGDVLNGYG